MTMSISGTTDRSLICQNQSGNKSASHAQNTVEAPKKYDSITSENNNVVGKVDLSNQCSQDSAPNRYEGLDSGEPAKETASELEGIKEKGLVAWFFEMNQEKIRNMILEEMGLSEEDLNNMPEEERVKLEKIIQQKIQDYFALQKKVPTYDGTSANGKQNSDVENVAFVISLKA